MLISSMLIRFAFNLFEYLAKYLAILLLKFVRVRLGRPTMDLSVVIKAGVSLH